MTCFWRGAEGGKRKGLVFNVFLCLCCVVFSALLFVDVLADFSLAFCMLKFFQLFSLPKFQSEATPARSCHTQRKPAACHQATRLHSKQRQYALDRYKEAFVLVA